MSDTTKKLSAQRQAFVEHYLLHWNGARAAREAGYSEKTARTTASYLLAIPDIRAHITNRLSELQMGSAEVHARLTEHGRADMAEFLTIKTRKYAKWRAGVEYDSAMKPVESTIDGEIYRPIKLSLNLEPSANPKYWELVERERYVDIDIEKALAAGKTGLLQKVGYNKHGGLEIELVSSQKALVEIGRIHAMFTDKQESNDPAATAAVKTLDDKLSELANRLNPDLKKPE